MRKRLVLLVAVAVVVLHCVAGILIADGALHNHRKPLKAADRAFALESAQQNDATIQDAEIRSYDGVPLSGWFFRPNHANGETVILIHGHADNRSGMKRLA